MKPTFIALLGGVLPASGLRRNIDKYMDEFLVDYLKANPKKKEKE